MDITVQCSAVHWEGEGEVAGAASGAALVAPEHGGSLGVVAAPGAGGGLRAARRRRELLGLGRVPGLRPLREGRQPGVRLRHGLVVEEVEVRPAAGVEVAGALDAEERLVRRHAPVGLRHRRPVLEDGRRDPPRIVPVVGPRRSEAGRRDRLDLRRLRPRRAAAVRRRERVVDGRRRWIRPRHPVVRLGLRAVHGGSGLYILRHRAVRRLGLGAVYGGSGSFVLQRRRVGRFDHRAVFVLGQRRCQRVDELDDIDVARDISRRRGRGGGGRRRGGGRLSGRLEFGALFLWLVRRCHLFRRCSRPGIVP
jgi:hypothetical protein